MQRIIRDSWLATLMIVVVTVGMATSTGGRGNATRTASALMQELLTSYDRKVSPAELTDNGLKVFVMPESAYYEHLHNTYCFAHSVEKHTCSCTATDFVNPGEPTAVKIGLFIKRVQVDFKTMTASSIVYFRQSWIDKRLQFDESNVTMKIFQLNDDDCDKVWLPDTFLSEEVAPTRVDHRLLKANPSGQTWYVQRWYITSSFHGSVYSLIIPFSFESFAYKTDSILLTPLDNPIDISDDIVFSHRIVSTNSLDCTTAYTTGSYPCLRLSVDAFRYDFAYGRKQLFVLAPVTLLVAVLSSTASWLSPSSTGGLVSRVLIGLVTSVLSIFIIVLKDGYVDQFGFSTFASDILITGCVLVAVVAFLESVTVIVLASTKSTENKKQDGNEATQSQWSNKLRRIDFVAKIFIPSAFVAFIIVFLIVLFR